MPGQRLGNWLHKPIRTHAGGMIATAVLALSLATCPREPPRKDSTFTVTCSITGTRHEIYGWCPSRTVDIYRVRKLHITRDRFGVVCEVTEEYSEPRLELEWRWRHFAPDAQRRAVREFIRWSCLTDNMVEYHRGDEVRRLPLSKLLNVDRMIGDDWFLQDESEWRTHTVYEAIIVPE